MKSFFSPFSLLTLYLAISLVSVGAYAYAEYYGRDILGQDNTKKERGTNGYHSSGSRIHHK